MPGSPDTIRVLFMADSHLGFDLPVRPRVKRRRRGHDFQANHDRALAAARTVGADLVVHGGDLFHRPGALPTLVFQAFRGLLEVADAGISVFVVPGNHERSRIPHPHLAAHPHLHIFDVPKTVSMQVKGSRVAVVGFPYRRRKVREDFTEILRETGCRDGAAEGDADGDVNGDAEVAGDADLRLLCMHHCVEGATVGPSDYTFRNAPDVIRGAELPETVAAVLSGHIHRPQILTRDLSGRALPAPVIYSGSVERTAFAEMGEEKGFFMLDFRPGPGGGALERQQFIRLPARPMVEEEVYPDGSGGGNGRTRPWDDAGGTRRNGVGRADRTNDANRGKRTDRPHVFARPSLADEGSGLPPNIWTAALLRRRIAEVVEQAPEDAVLRLRVHGVLPANARAPLSAASLRRMAPPEMNLEVLVVEDRGRRAPWRRGGPVAPSPGPSCEVGVLRLRV